MNTIAQNSFIQFVKLAELDCCTLYSERDSLQCMGVITEKQDPSWKEIYYLYRTLYIFKFFLPTVKRQLLRISRYLSNKKIVILTDNRSSKRVLSSTTSYQQLTTLLTLTVTLTGKLIRVN